LENISILNKCCSF